MFPLRARTGNDRIALMTKPVFERRVDEKPFRFLVWVNHFVALLEVKNYALEDELVVLLPQEVLRAQHPVLVLLRGPFASPADRHPGRSGICGTRSGTRG
eukprot:SAG31_NODE_990_length_10529_cov_37.528340_2_plen_100_part_00